MGEPKRGVFVYKDDLKEKIQVNKVISHEVWLRMIGHPSNKAFSKVPSNIQLDSVSKHKDKVCDVCLHAK